MDFYGRISTLLPKLKIMKLTNHMRVLTLFSLLLIASPSMAITEPVPVAETAESRAMHLQNRLEEIKSIDKTTVSRAEKKALRREVREIKKELAAISGGVYLSIGAIILIALLLILLL